MEATPLDWSLISTVLISLSLGGIIGLERQSHREPESHFGSLGMRTFALAALLGTAAVFAEEVLQGIVYVVGFGYFALLVVFFWHERRATEHEVGITTQVSAMAVFVIGVLVPSQPLFAASLAVFVAIILSVKRYTSRFVRLLTPTEIISTMKFLLVTVVLLPLLPNQPIDPWGYYNPREVWLLVVLISGISFMAYFAIRFMGARRGLTLTGILGGMASSTAVTLAMARQVRTQPESRTVMLSAAFAIMLATAFMFVRVSAAVAVINFTLIGTLWVPFVAMAIPGTIIAGGMWLVLSRHMKEQAEQFNGSGEEREVVDEASDEAERSELADDESDGDAQQEEERQEMVDGDEHDGEDGEKADDAVQEPELDIRNPFELTPALQFAVLLMIIIGVANFLQDMYGGGAIYVAAIFGGLAETNAISLAVARMENIGDLSASVATQAIVIAILANSIVKAILASVVGSRRLGLYVTGGLLPIFAVGLGASFLL